MLHHNHPGLVEDIAISSSSTKHGSDHVSLLTPDPATVHSQLCFGRPGLRFHGISMTLAWRTRCRVFHYSLFVLFDLRQTIISRRWLVVAVFCAHAVVILGCNRAWNICLDQVYRWRCPTVLSCVNCEHWSIAFMAALMSIDHCAGI